MHTYRTIIHHLFAPNKGIIATDDRPSGMDKRLDDYNIKASKKNRTLCREIIATTPGVERFVSGIIFNEETLQDRLTDGRKFDEVMHARGMIIGIKVDEGLLPYQDSPIEKVSTGIVNLEKKLLLFKKHGAQFCKWRSVFTISDTTPSIDCIIENCRIMSTYAKIALENGFVPILEPEVLMDGNHTIEKCHTITSQVLRHLFEILQKEGVDEVNIILKCNMVLPGDTAKIKVPPQEAERHTIEVLSTSVPRDVGGIVFLSGGQSTLEATLNLNAIGQIKSAPWPISFSFDRAFVLPVLHIWQGHNQNIPNAQKKLLEAVKGTSQALVGKYQL